MDPLTVLGGTAAAAQLLQQGANITKFLWDLYSKMKDSPAAIRRQTIQIEQLLDLSRLFLQNASLQTDSVASILGTCLLQAQQFQQILKKVAVTGSDGQFKTLKKSFEAVMKEKEIVQLFDNLEREKSSLMLCIQQIDNTLLHTIDVDIKDIKDGIDNMAHVVTDTAHDTTTLVKTLASMSTQVTEIQIDVKSLQSLKLETQVSTSSIGHTSSHYLVPKRRVREFIGREDILARIDSGFSTTSDQTPRIVVIRGLGGQGKTQVALEYCRRAKNDGVRAIFWVDAMSESNVQNGYKTISESIKDPGQIIEDEARVRFVMEKLEIWRGPWILVFDNHDDPSAFNLQDYIPEGDGRILVTSRHADTDYLTDREKVIQLDGLPVEDALELLFKQSRLKATESNLQHGKLIVKRLGYHALAITQAGSYVHLRKIEFHDFLDHYSRQRKDILQQTPQMSQYRRKLNNTADEDETVLTVFTTWELSFQLLVTQEIPGIQKAEILTLFAFFDSKDISEELFRIYCNRKRPRKDSAKFGQRLMGSFLDKKGSWNHQLFVEVLVNLTQMSLVQAWSYDEDRVCHFTLHPLVKDWIRLRAIATAFRDYAIITSDILSCLLYSCYHHNQFELSMSNRLATLSHLESYKENLESIISNADDFNSIYRHFENAEGWFSGFLEQNGYAKRAEEMSRRLSNWLETTLGLEDSKTLTALSNLALVLQELGKYEEAEEMNRRALQSREKVLEPEHPDTLVSLNNLALVLQELGKYEEAEKINQRALQCREKVLEPEHPDTLVSLSNLALVLRKLGKYEEAEEMNRRALQSREKVLGPEHPDTLVSLNNLALVLQGLGKYEEAEKINQRALQCREKVLGPEHPDTLCSVWGMAVDMEMNQKYDDAVPYYQRACSGYKKVLGEGHPDTVSCMRGYSEMIEYMKQLEAKPSNPTE